ncbi:N/A [soil metagenome]
MVTDKAIVADYSLLLVLKRSGKLKGEAVIPGHEGEIIVLDFEYGARADSKDNSLDTAVRRLPELKIMKSADRSTTGLLQACSSGEQIKEAVLSARRAGALETDFFKLTFENAFVSSFTTKLERGSMPIEEIKISYQSVEIQYRPQLGNGQHGPVSTARVDIGKD